MKEIRIFLASSSELATDRARIGNLVRKLNEETEKRFIHLRLVKWEDHDSFYNRRGKQGEYDHLIRNSDFFIALFWHVAGGYTVHEVEVARGKDLPVRIYRRRSPIDPDSEENADVQWLAGHSSGEDLDAFLARQPEVADYASFDDLAADLTAALKRFCDGIAVGEEEKRPYSSDVLQIHAVASPEVEPDLAKLGDLVRYLDENSKHYCRIKMIDVIPGSDLFVSLCHTSAPEPVPGEIGQAIECSKKAPDARPKLFFCLKKADEALKTDSLRKMERLFSETFSHFPDRYAQSAELRLHFLLELERLKKECPAVTLTVENGIVWQQNGETKSALMRCEDMISLRKDPGYIALKAERDRLLDEIEDLKERDRGSAESLAGEIRERYVKLQETQADIASKEDGHLRLMRTLEDQVGQEQDGAILKLRELILNGRIEEALLLLPDRRSQRERWEDRKQRRAGEDRRAIDVCRLTIDCLSAGNAKKNRDDIADLYELMIEIAHDLKDEEKEAAACYDYALFLFNWGRYGEALEVSRKALAIRLRIFGEDHPDTANSYSMTASALCREGDYDAALELDRRALAAYLRVFGENHPRTAGCYNDIGQNWFKKGDYDRALDFHRRAQTAYLRVFGENHSIMAGCYNDIGSVLSAKGDQEQALDFHRRALAAYLRVFGENHKFTAGTYHNLGADWSRKGDYDKGLDFYRRSLDITLRVLGENHPGTARICNDIGVNWFKKGDYDKCLEFYRKALATHLCAFGENHPDTARIYCNIGIVLFKKGDYDECLDFYRKALDIRRRILGENHPDTAVSYRSVGVVLSRRGDAAGAEKHFRRAYEIAKRFPGVGICAKIIEKLSYLDDPK